MNLRQPDWIAHIMMGLSSPLACVGTGLALLRMLPRQGQMSRPLGRMRSSASTAMQSGQAAAWPWQARPQRAAVLYRTYHRPMEGDSPVGTVAQRHSGRAAWEGFGQHSLAYVTGTYGNRNRVGERFLQHLSVKSCAWPRVLPQRHGFCVGAVHGVWRRVANATYVSMPSPASREEIWEMKVPGVWRASSPPCLHALLCDWSYYWVIVPITPNKPHTTHTPHKSALSFLNSRVPC